MLKVLVAAPTTSTLGRCTKYAPGHLQRTLRLLACFRREHAPRCQVLFIMITMEDSKPCLKTPVTRLPGSLEARSRLLSLLWGCTIPAGVIDCGNVHSDPYLEYYSQQCDSFLVEQSNHWLDDDQTIFQVKTHQDIINMAARLTQGLGVRERQSIVEELWALSTMQTQEVNATIHAVSLHEATIEASINWAARLLTMMEIGTIACGFSPSRPLIWEKGSLRDFVTQHFTPTKSDFGRVRLEKTFNARNLERIAGITVEWTSDLASHLSLRDDDTKILIFHHATFLEHSHR